MEKAGTQAQKAKKEYKQDSNAQCAGENTNKNTRGTHTKQDAKHTTRETNTMPKMQQNDDTTKKEHNNRKNNKPKMQHMLTRRLETSKRKEKRRPMVRNREKQRRN